MSARVLSFADLRIAVVEPRGALISERDVSDLVVRSLDLLEQGNRKLIIDLGAVSYLNSTGLGALIEILRGYEASEGTVVLCSPNRNLQNLLAMTRLVTVFQVLDTRAEAIEYLEHSLNTAA